MFAGPVSLPLKMEFTTAEPSHQFGEIQFAPRFTVPPASV